MFSNLHGDVALLKRKAKEGKYSIEPTWGYLVYRATHKNQQLWDDYLRYLYQAVEDTVDWRVSEDLWVNPDLPINQRVGSESELWVEAYVIKSTFHLCNREGPEFEGRSIEDIKEINKDWLRKLKELPESEFSQMDGCLPNHLDRDNHQRTVRMAKYQYFIYADEKALAKFQEIRAANTIEGQDFAPSYKHNVAVKIAWAGYIEDESDYEDMDEDEPDRTKIWQYLHIYRLPRFYDRLVGSNEAWWNRFARPPRVNMFRGD
ncbi:hypothetical protein B0T11DRAFT_295731 [Plectosphaerella cucumerina]|uniref:Uncharacterized protein n=1 Tax=Plectosphaerella cucumerina TaxID=40658 RepID=A0A8K0TI95_9PEZI|nr:hypothetical protein B0T11DRAFT_295731 [Plectosphaerella cucumerina]